MPQIVISKKSLEPPSNLPPGVYDVRLDGFKPDKTKAKPGKDQSVNLNPVLTVINNPDPEINNKRVYCNLNEKAGWIIVELVHGFGLEMIDAGDGVRMPGEFGPANELNPTKWTYQGDLLGRVAKVELIETDSTTPGRKRTEIKRFFCQVPGCKVVHIENLAKAA